MTPTETEALAGRIDQIIGWAKSGIRGEYYLMDRENVDTMRDDILRDMTPSASDARWNRLREHVTAERAVLSALEAGCSAPLGALAEVVEGEDGEELWLRAVALSEDGGLSVRMSGLVHGLSFTVLVAFVALSIAALYRFGPTPRPGRVLRVWPGTLTATPLWLAASFGLSAYVTRLANFDLTYGPLAALAGVMLWFWVSSYVVLLGAALNAVLSDTT